MATANVPAPHVSGTEFRFVDGQKIDRKAGTIADAVKIKESLSSNGRTRYMTTLWSDGVLTCDCPGWTIKRKNSYVRTCKHCKSSITSHGDDMAALADFVPAEGAPVKRAQVRIPQVNTRHITIRK